MPVRSDQNGRGSLDLAQDGKLPHAFVLGVDQPDARPGRKVETTGFTEVEEHGAGVVQEREHARVLPLATGIKMARPELVVCAVGGDGDAFSIGMGHFPHAARRNVDITYIVMDNEIYGLTKGQTSPTSMVGFVTKTTPKGTPDRPVNPLQLAMASGATFVARAFSGKPMELADLIVRRNA